MLNFLKMWGFQWNFADKCGPQQRNPAKEGRQRVLGAQIFAGENSAKGTKSDLRPRLLPTTSVIFSVYIYLQISLARSRVDSHWELELPF